MGNAIDVPVWVERQTVDLKICMFDRLYQDTILVNNRATTALRLKFEVCKELRNHLELLPKTGYIQAQSQFSAQLKFVPRSVERMLKFHLAPLTLSYVASGSRCSRTQRNSSTRRPACSKRP